MIVGAGLGTRLGPLTELCAKPAVPVRGISVVGYQLALLSHYGVTEVAINLHHLPDTLREAAMRDCPRGVTLYFSEEPELLDTGGGIAKMASFLRESDPSIIVSGDMILDTDLSALVAAHRDAGDLATLLLLDDPRKSTVGSIGVDAAGRVRRVARRFDLGGETRSGLYVWANAVSPRAFDTLPAQRRFSHLDDWWMPLLAQGAEDIRGEVVTDVTCRWEPVGTLEEYLEANLRSRELPYLDAEAAAREAGVELRPELVLGRGAILESGASLQRAVVWDGERVSSGIRATDGVFAGGRYHPCRGTRVTG